MKSCCKKIFLTLCLIATVMLVGCQAEKDPYARYRQFDAATLFTQSEKYLAQHNYDRAIETLEALEILYPFGPHAEQTQLYLIYAYYKNKDMGATIAATGRYIRLYPRGQHLDYVYYMKAMSNFNYQKGLLNKIFRQDKAHRDLTLTEQSFKDFKYVTERFPNSPYAAHAREQMVFLLDMLARAEYYTGEYYYRRGAYVAAANRGVYIIDNYPQSTETAKALALMTKSYRHLGMREKEDNALRVLELNFPESAELAEVMAPPETNTWLSWKNRKAKNG